jgi:SAM-dependent methyltransferase
MEYVTKCPACNSANFKAFIHTAAMMHEHSSVKYNFDRCNDCGLVFLNPRVPESALGVFYTSAYLPYRVEEAWGKYAAFVKRDQQKIDQARVERVKKHHRWTAQSRILDVGCGKGFLLHELLILEPGLLVTGTDISEYGLSHATDLVKPYLIKHDARGEFKWGDKEFDLVISLTMIHNLRAFELENCLRQIQRIGKSHYVTAESYRNELEQFNLQCWALTCETFFDFDEWLWMFEKSGYTGDFEFIYFE